MKGSIPEATNVVLDLRENHGIFCSIVVYPVVPKDVILLRLIPTAAHSMEDVERTIASFKEVKKKLESGVYRADKVAAM
jgi:glycine C-acetyltransferase